MLGYKEKYSEKYLSPYPIYIIAIILPSRLTINEKYLWPGC